MKKGSYFGGYILGVLVAIEGQQIKLFEEGL